MQPFNQSGQQHTPQQPMPMSGYKNQSAHGVLDGHAVLSKMIIAFNEYLLCEQYVKDPELMDILQRQRKFLTDQYNITVETFRSGQDPSHPTSSYQMNQSNDVLYGLTPSQPTKPNQQVGEIGDKCCANIMMNCMKSLASATTLAASESTNPVLRRVLADSIPNYLEMAYETFLYLNKKGYYQVGHLPEKDMQQLTQAFTTVPTNGMMQ